MDTVGQPEKYQEKMQRVFPSLNIIVAKKADALYPVVSAASIAAKVTRDRIVDGWKFEENDNGTAVVDVGEWGSGYPGDPATKKFLTKTIDKFFGFSMFVRFDWQTVKTLLIDKKKAIAVVW